METQHQEKRDLIFVSNRLPYSVHKANGVLQSSLSSGDFVAALSGNLSTRSTRFRWFGCSGINVPDPNERKDVSDALARNHAVGIFFDEQLVHDYYHRFSNSIIWPVLHYQSDIEFDEDVWKAYVRVNEIFAETVAEEAIDGNIIWVHDYHLLLLPKLLRGQLDKRGKHCPIGFTLHTPFPGEDFWKAIPVKKELLEGILASDVVGFHTDEYKRNFLRTCSRNLGACTEVVGYVKYHGHRTLIDTFILPIDPQKFNDSVQDPYVQERIKQLEDKYKNVTIMIGVDRLDHTKRMTQKLQGYDYFLSQHPELKGKVTLIQASIQSQDFGDDYQELESDISTLAEQINEKHATHDWSPLVYMRHSFSFTELTALFCVSDICLLASRRGGMNLVATEYMSCQEKKHGVFVISELSGAESFINAGSITFNPSNMQEISDAIHMAVTMNEAEKEERYRYLRSSVINHTRSAKRGQTFITALVNRAQKRM